MEDDGPESIANPKDTTPFITRGSIISYSEKVFQNHPAPPPLFKSWSILAIVAIYVAITIALGGGAVISFAHTNVHLEKLSTKEWFSVILSTAPLVGLLLLLTVPSIAKGIAVFLKDNLAPQLYALPFAALITTCYIFSGILFGHFNPLVVVFIFGTCYCSIESVRLLGSFLGIRYLTAIDFAIWLLLWVPLDLRWVYTEYWDGVGFMAYDWWALTFTLLAILSWGVFREFEGFGFRLCPPTLKDFLCGALALIPLAVVILPVGIFSDFLTFPPENAPSTSSLFSFWVENVLTVAITEEIFFRAVLYNGINQNMPSKHGWIGIILSSVLFGLMHIPRRNSLLDQFLYASFSFIAGICYALAYRYSGNNILAPVLTHSITDTVWEFALT